MTWPSLKLTAGPGDDSAVLVTLHDPFAGVDVDKSGLSLGSPSVTYDAVGGMQEGTRDVSITMTIRGDSDHAARFMSRVGQALTRRVVYLRWQHSGSTPPFWLRVLPLASFGDLDLAKVFAGGIADRSRWVWTLAFQADAFALGERVELNPVTIYTPGNLTDVVTLEDDIVGSAPAPLCADIPAGNVSGYRTLFSSWATDPAATRAPWLKLSGTDGSDRAFTPTAGAATVSGDNIRVTSPGTTIARRCTADPLDPANQLPPGRYRAYVYVRRVSGTGWCRVALRQDFFTEAYGTDAKRFDPQGPYTEAYVDCGTVTFPTAVDPTELPEDAAFPATWSVWLQGDGTTTTWDIVSVLLTPVNTSNLVGSSRAIASWWRANVDATIRIDSEHSRVGVISGSGALYAEGQWLATAPPLVDGGWPMLQPGATNHLVFIPRTNDDASLHSGDFGTGGDALLWYYPRHLHIGGRS